MKGERSTLRGADNPLAGVFGAARHWFAGSES